MRPSFMALSLVILATGCQPTLDPRPTEPPVVRTPEQIALDTACPVAPSPYLADAKARGALTVVGIGSSSMEGIGASAPQYNFVSRLDATLKAALPGVAVRTINAGIGGQNLPQMIARFEKDVYANKPDLVVFQAGMNDALGKRDPEAYRRELQGALGDLKIHNVNVALMSNQYAGVGGYASQPEVATLDQINKEEAAKRGISVIDRYTLFKSLEGQGVNVGATYFTPDTLHTNDEGYRLVTTCAVRRVFGLS